MVERARAAAAAGLDSLFVGDHHNVPVPYYQNVPILGRLLAEWDDRPAGALFLLPLWHPVLVAEQIGTLAAIAAGPVHHAVRGRWRRRAVPRASTRRCASGRRACEAALDIVRALCRGRDGDRRRRTVADRPGPHRTGPARAAEVWIGAVVSRRRSTAPPRHRRRVPDRTGGHADARSPTLVETYRDACARHGRSPPTGSRCGATCTSRRPTKRPRSSPTRSSPRGYRGFDPSAVVVGGPGQVTDAFAALGAAGLHRCHRPPPRRRPGGGPAVVRTARDASGPA